MKNIYPQLVRVPPPRKNLSPVCERGQTPQFAFAAPCIGAEYPQPDPDQRPAAGVAPRWLVGRQLEGVLDNFGPDGTVYPLWVAPCRRKQVEHEQVDAGLQELYGFLDEGTQAVTAGLVVRRDDLDLAAAGPGR